MLTLKEVLCLTGGILIGAVGTLIWGATVVNNIIKERQRLERENWKKREESYEKDTVQ